MEHQGFKQVLRPWLLEKLNQSFPDPSGFKDDNEFTYAAKVTSVFKKVVSELIDWFDMHKREAEFLEKKEKGEVTDPFRIGGDL